MHRQAGRSLPHRPGSRPVQAYLHIPDIIKDYAKVRARWRWGPHELGLGPEPARSASRLQCCLAKVPVKR